MFTVSSCCVGKKTALPAKNWFRTMADVCLRDVLFCALAVLFFYAAKISLVSLVSFLSACL